MKNKGENLEEKKKIMLQWKKLYLEALINELKPFGDVLEVGFGYGYAADQIQKFSPKTHTIIESNPQLAKEAKNWATKHPNVKVIEGTWQEKLGSLGTFDAIFFNGFPIDNEMGMMNRIHPEEISQKSTQAKELLNRLESQLSQLKMHYTDEQIEDFYQKIGQFHRKELQSFFSKLKEYGYITEEQHRRTLQKYPMNQADLQEDINLDKDETFAFLNECLNKHTHKGSRFSCFSNDITSKYEDAQFFENIITNPYFDFHEKLVPIKVPHFSEYFKFDEALILVIEKFR